MTINKARLAKLAGYFVAWIIITVLIYPVLEASTFLSGNLTWVFSGFASFAIVVWLHIFWMIGEMVWEWLND